MSMERYCPLALETGEFDFIVIVCSKDLLGSRWDHVYLDGHVHTYVHSIEHALERERSDGCSRGKVLRSISLGRILAME